MQPTLSIVLPTCNRASLLESAIRAITLATSIDHELIVVDGASTDDTRDVLDAAKRAMGDRLQVIHEPTREGFVKGTNKGFRAARGKYLCWLNDDARPIAGALDSAVDQLRRAPADVGFVAIFHAWHSTRNVAYQCEHGDETYSLCHVRGTLYANFPVGRTQTFRDLGYFDERYYVCAADPDLSLKAWHAGMRVEPAWGCVIEHDEVEDDRRAVDSERGRRDNEALFAKWDLPMKNAERNEFDPRRPSTLRGMYEVKRAA